MDRNAITGIVLMTLLTIGYLYFFAPTPPPPTEKEKTTVERGQDSADSVTTTEPDTAVAVTEKSPALDADSLDMLKKVQKLGEFASLSKGKPEEVTITTDKLTLTISTQGGAITAAYLNEFKTFDSLPLPVITDHPNNTFFFEFYNSDIQSGTKSSDLFFTPSQKSLEVRGQDSVKLVLKAQLDGNRSIEQIYSFRGDTYDVGYEVKFNRLKDVLGRQTYYNINWSSYLPKTELSIDNMRLKTTIAYRQGNDVEKLTASDEPTEEKINTNFDWVSFKSQFFSSILVSDKPFRSGKVNMRTPQTDEINRVMDAKMKVDINLTDEISNKFTWYLGPNEYTTLNAYDLALEEEMDLGWWIISYINVGTTYIFKFLEKYISNYGIIIIILAFLIRSLVFPLTYKSYVSMAKMRVLNQTPEMKALDEKHKGDPQKLQMAKMGIYREMGVSMFGGCLPMLFSYPFLIALFFFFPQSVELRQQSFLWANDLSTYDSILNLPFNIPGYGDHVSLFTLLMALSTFVYTYYQQKSQPTAAANPAFKYIAYFMPLILLIFLNNYSSGLSLYYLTSNIISISQTVLIRRFLDDDAILEQMRETQKQMKGKKGKKKSGGRLQKWVEQQQKKQQEMLKQRQQTDAKNRRGRRGK